jgi:hypothetical protein
MPRPALWLTPCAVLFGVSAACGSGARTGLPIGVAACTGVPVSQVRQVPNLYFILDRSNSMSHASNSMDPRTPSKWEVVRHDIASLVTTLGADARFGAAWFPLGAMGPCDAGREIMPPRIGDGLPGTKPGSTAQAFLNATNSPPVGGTPTAATFLALTPELESLPGHTFAILATDGGPNCNPALTCGEDQCTLNLGSASRGCTPHGPVNCCDPTTPGANQCLDADRTVAAVADLAAKGVPTFVIGVPGSEIFASVLDDVAKAGRTARASEPYYYPVNTADASELVDALANIAARIAASCKVELKEAPPGDQTNLVVDGDLVPQSGAWTVSGNVVTLLGETCDRVRTDGAKVVVTEGCPTLLE